MKQMDITRVHYVATVKVVGLGGNGADAISRIVGSSLEGVESVLIHTEDRPTAAYDSDVKINLGRIPGAPEGALDEPSLVEIRSELAEALKGADMIVLIAGEDSQPEVRVAPIMGEIAKDNGALIAGVVTRNSTLEETYDPVQVEEGIQLLREAVDMMIMVPDETLLPGLLVALRGE